MFNKNLLIIKSLIYCFYKKKLKIKASLKKKLSPKSTSMIPKSTLIKICLNWYANESKLDPKVHTIESMLNLWKRRKYPDVIRVNCQGLVSCVCLMITWIHQSVHASLLVSLFFYIPQQMFSSFSHLPFPLTIIPLLSYISPYNFGVWTLFLIPVPTCLPRTRLLHFRFWFFFSVFHHHNQ